MNPAVTSCRECRSETAWDDFFCQDCGAPQHNWVLSEPEPQLQAPKIQTASFGNISRLRTEGDRAPSAVPFLLPLAAIIIIVFLVLPSLLRALDGAYNSISKQFMYEQAQKHERNGKLEEALNIMTLLERSGTCDKHQIAFLDRVLFEHAVACAGIGNFGQALIDLSRITPNYKDFKAVQEKTKQYQGDAEKAMAHLKKHESRPSEPNQSASSVPRQGPSLRIEDMFKSAISLPNTVIRHKRQEEDLPEERSDEDVRSDAKDLPNLPSVEPGSVNPALAGARPTPGSVNPPLPRRPAKTEEQASKEGDLIRYNELLAGYFSRGPQGTHGSAHEPPSFKEWLSLGKPNF